MTSPTGASLARLKVPASRVVVKAVIPKSANSVTGSWGVEITMSNLLSERF
jgi:hypothetical protein